VEYRGAPYIRHEACCKPEVIVDHVLWVRLNVSWLVDIVEAIVIDDVDKLVVPRRVFVLGAS